MKRSVLTAALVAVMLFAVGAPAVATTPKDKAATVALYVNGVEDVAEVTVEQGAEVDFKAVTLKQGSSMTDEWKGAVSTPTVLNTETGNYEAAATLDTTGMSVGEHEVEYSIVMAAGKSQVTFSGNKKTSVVVVDTQVSVKKIKITVIEATTKNGKNFQYTATAEAELSDGTSLALENIEFTYNTTSAKTSEVVPVNVDLDGDGTTDLTFELEIEVPVTVGDEIVFNDPLPVE